MTAAKARMSSRRRAFFALALVAALIGAFMVRLVDLQVVNAAEYVDASREKTGSSRPLPGTRGEIVDENGTVLAASTLTYDAVVDPANISDKGVERRDDKNAVTRVDLWPQMAAKIGEITGQTGAAVEQLVADAKAANPGARYAPVAKRISTAQRQQLDALDLPYLAFQSNEARTYPDGSVAGNIVGFVGQDDNDQSRLKAQAGLELAQNSCLQAKDGKETYQRGTNGEMIPGSLRQTPAEDGGTLQTTINADLQFYLEQMIGEEVQNQAAKYGSVMVVETKTGAIRAAAESSTVDPNDPGASDANDRGSRIFTNTFEPGSTFKAATAAMLLESGTATPMSTVDGVDSWHTFPNGAEVGDAFGHDTYTYTLAGALIDSSNVALSMFGEKMTPEARHDYLQKFGVGQPTGVDFPGEQDGILNPASSWDNQTVYATTFGQAFTVTAPQVASFYQMIANGGVKVPLKIVESCTKADGTVVQQKTSAPERILSAQNAAEMNRMIENVAEQGGVSDLIKVPGYRIAAKTGTAQTLDEVNGGYKKGVYDTSIVGFAPADDPQYVVIVTLKEPTKVTSSTATAPAFQKAMTQVMKTFRVMPSATPFTDPLRKFG